MTAPTFADTVLEHWCAGADVRGRPDAEDSADGVAHVVVTDALPVARPLEVLHPVDGAALIRVTADLAARLGLTAGSNVARGDLGVALDRAGLRLNGADHLAYPTVTDRGLLLAGAGDAVVRRLGPQDAGALAVLRAATPAAEVDEAWVELDHALVVGAEVDGALACVASAVPWRGSTLADVGVLTRPDVRGRGLARRTVRELAARLLAAGLEPQYRCQLDNAASLALSRASGFTRFATWDVLADVAR